MTRRLDLFTITAASLLALLCLTTGPVKAGEQTPAPPQLETGLQLSFTTTTETAKTGEASQGALGTFAEARGQAFVEPLPYTQTVTVGEVGSCGEHRCIGVAISQDVPPFVPGLEDQKCGKTIKAQVDLDTGDVLDIRTQLIIGDSISNSKQGRYGTDSTLGHFYGPWMAELSDSYERELEHDTKEVRTIKVTGREQIHGHDCFVVKRLRSLASGQEVTGTVWVDVARRFALQVSEGGRIMRLAD